MQTPRQMLEGGFKADLIVDSEAPDEQAGVLGQMFGGRLGGPMAGLAPLISEFIGMERLPVNVEHDGKNHHIVVGDSIGFDISMQSTDEGEPVQFTNIVVHPAGPTLDIGIARHGRQGRRRRHVRAGRALPAQPPSDTGVSAIAARRSSISSTTSASVGRYGTSGPERVTAGSASAAAGL